MIALCESLARLLDAIPAPIRRPVDLERTLKVDQPLASRLWRLAAAGSDPARALSLLPTANQLRAAVRAAEHARAPADAVRAAMAAVDQFDAFVHAHAGDLHQFEAMVARGAPLGNEHLALKHRRADFKASSQVWGRRARALSACTIVYRSQHPETQDSVVVRGFIDLEVLDPRMAIGLRARLRYLTPGQTFREAPRPTDHQARVEIPRLLEGFGDGPRPSLVEVPDDVPGVVSVQVRLPGIGKSGASTFFLDQVVSDIDAQSRRDATYDLQLFVTLPLELLQMELWVETGLSEASTMRCSGYADINDPERARQCRDTDRIEIHARAEHLRTVSQPAATPDIPGWSNVLRHVLEKHALTGRQFDVYRARVAYPLLHSVVRLWVEAAQPA